ncbi:MAG: hypothetical protein ACYC69_07200 [Thermodesulfovibrionales bacterium]
MMEIYARFYSGVQGYDGRNRGRSLTWIEQLRRIVRYFWCGAIVLVSMAASDCFALNQTFEYLHVEIESISYQGRNKYKVDITVNNRTADTITIKEHSASFSVQTEILGQWKEVTTSASGAAVAVLPPHKVLQMSYVLTIPLTIPSLYRNSEGDINMMFKYLLRFVAGSNAGLRRYSGESSYWITPKTAAWVLREGM